MSVVLFLLPNLQTQDCLYGREQGGNIEGLKEDLGSRLTVLHWVQGRLSQQDGML